MATMTGQDILTTLERLRLNYECRVWLVAALRQVAIAGLRGEDGLAVFDALAGNRLALNILTGRQRESLHNLVERSTTEDIKNILVIARNNIS